MFTPMLRAISQLDDPVFLGVVLRSLVLSLVAFLALLAGSVWALDDLVGQGSLLGWLAGALGGIGALLLAVWLFVPAAVVIATLFIDRVAVAVERRFYPGLQAPVGAPLSVQVWDGIALGIRVMAWQIAALLASVFVPVVGLALGYLVTGWAIGRGLFVAVAMRRMDRPEAIALYNRSRLAALVPGVALALAATVPLLNLLVPVLGIATMVHVIDQRRPA